ncbi:MAG: hypothetical protein IPM42_20735 [Saprospiraceae bacterium]|nr:hypothetical protein [Saprospiraceae bacterium]
MNKKLIVESTWDYYLESDDYGNLYFEVVCGTVAIYTITFLLNESEKLAWQLEGDIALKHLAYRVRDWPQEYILRKVI